MNWKLLLLLALTGYCSVVSQSTATESENTGETASPSVNTSGDEAESSSQIASASDTSSADEAEGSSQTASQSDTSSADEAEGSSQTASQSDTSGADEAEGSSQTASQSDTSSADEAEGSSQTASQSDTSSADEAEGSSQTASQSDTSGADEAEGSSQTASQSDTSSADEAEGSSQTASQSDTSSADEAEGSSQTASQSDTSSADEAEGSSQTASPSDTSSADEDQSSSQPLPVPHHRHPHHRHPHHRHPRPGPGRRPGPVPHLPLPPRARGIISDIINVFNNGIVPLGPRPVNRGRPGPRRIPRSSGDEEDLSDVSDDSDLELPNVDEPVAEVPEIPDPSDLEIPEIPQPPRSKGITVADLINAFNNGIAPLGPRPVNRGRPAPRRIPRSSGDQEDLSDVSDDSDLEISNVDELVPEAPEISDPSDLESSEIPSPALPPRSKGITVADLINAFNNGIAPLGPRPVNRGRPGPRRIPRSSGFQFTLNAALNPDLLNGNSLPDLSGIPNISDFELPNVDELVPEIPEISDPSDLEVPEIPNLPKLPMIPRLRAAISQARKNLANELGAGQDLHSGIHDAIETGLRSSNPTETFRGLVSTILQVYLECALNCPLLIVGGYVMREGLLLAANILIAIADVSAQIQGV